MKWTVFKLRCLCEVHVAWLNVKFRCVATDAQPCEAPADVLQSSNLYADWIGKDKSLY
jgi:hypothetical protein